MRKFFGVAGVIACIIACGSSCVVEAAQKEHERKGDNITGIKRDIDILKNSQKKMEKDMACLESNMERDMALLKNNITGGMEYLRNDIEKDTGALRSDMEKNMGALRSDMEKNMEHLRSNIEKDMTTLKNMFIEALSALSALKPTEFPPQPSKKK
jgi:hypothetical protein